MKLYGSLLCPDCPPVIRLFEDKGIDFEFVDITDSIGNLKEFLGFRDVREEFDDVKANGNVGIPCLMTDDGEILFYQGIFRRYEDA